MNRFLTALFVCILLILALSGSLLLNERAVRVSAQAELTYERTQKQNLLCLMLAYPNHIAGIRRAENGLVYVVMQSGDEILYDDMKQKSFNEQFYSADLQDMLAIRYPLEAIEALREGNDDPGRIRCYAFLHAVYGKTINDIEKNLKSANVVSGCCAFAVDAAPALEDAMQQLAEYVRRNPSAYGYVFPVNGTYNYRMIAGTNLLSAHAFGIAIDLKSNPCDYWRWATRQQGQSRLDDYPAEVVKIMESRGFIWGGKWAHFDFLHFEYRPELILKARYALNDDASQPWYFGFPEDAQTKAFIGVIEEALGS